MVGKEIAKVMMYTEVKKRPGAPRTIFFVGGSDWVVADNTVTGWV